MELVLRDTWDWRGQGVEIGGNGCGCGDRGVGIVNGDTIVGGGDGVVCGVWMWCGWASWFQDW